MTMPDLKEVEALFFQKFADIDITEVPLVFILGSPRTGSTLLYQILINFFDFFYFSNFINDYFYEFPVVGAALSLHLNHQGQVEYTSEYGKTQGYTGPSEASSLFRKWFGGEHPSQTHSCKVLPDQKAHLIQTMKSIFQMMNRPILTKNAWNCFRIKALTELFPQIHFVWIRRDIHLSALSDLKARRVKGGSSFTWNSATTANYREIQEKPYWEQVVEQQYEYNKSIAYDLKQFCPEQYLELWYEDICNKFTDQLEKIRQYFTAHVPAVRAKEASVPVLHYLSEPDTTDDDYTKIACYVQNNLARFQSSIYNCC